MQEHLGAASSQCYFNTYVFVCVCVCVYIYVYII